VAHEGTLSGSGFVRVPTANDFGGSRILDATGAPYSISRDPLPGADKARATGVVRDIPVSIVALRWTVAEIAQALESHALGQFASSAMLADAIGGDDRVQAALGSRVGALFGLPISFGRGAADASGEVLEAWKQAYPRCTESPLVGNALSEIKRWAHLLGFGVGEIQWDTSVTPWQPFLRPLHPMHFWLDVNRRTLVASTVDGPVDVTPGDGRWFVHAPNGVQRGYMQGAVRALALPWLLRSLARRDWARYSERHGLPLIRAVMPAMAKAEDKDRFVSSLATMGTEAVVSLPQGIDGTGFDVSLIEAASQSWEGFDRLIVRCDSAITLCLQWQNLTTEVKEGSFAAARVHSDVKQSAVEFDESTLSRDVDWQIGRPFALWNYGNALAAPSTHWDVTPLEDKIAECQALETFARALASLRQAGEAIDVAALAKAYRVRLPLAQAAAARSAPIYAYHMTGGVVTANEVRARLDLEPRDDGDRLLGAAAAAPAPPEPKT
jgi:phage gp29-like protein